MYTYDINIAKLTDMNILNKLSIRFRIWETHVRDVLYLFDNHKVNDPEHYKLLLDVGLVHESVHVDRLMDIIPPWRN